MALKMIVGALLALLVGAGIAWAQGQFSDVNETHPQYDDIQYAVEQGWYVGYPDGTFKPDKLLTTDQAVIVFGRAFPDGVSRADLATILVGGNLRLDDLRASVPGGQSSSSVPPDVGTWTGFEGEGVDGKYYGYSVEATSYMGSHRVYPPSLYLRCGRDNTVYNDIFIATPWYLPADEDGYVLARSRFSHQDEPIGGLILSNEESDGSVLFANFDSGAFKTELTNLDDQPTNWFIEISDTSGRTNSATFELSHTAIAVTNLACFS